MAAPPGGAGCLPSPGPPRDARPRGAREISYAGSAGSAGARAVACLIENAGGRVGLIRRALGYEKEIARGEDFWAVMRRRYGIDLKLVAVPDATVIPIFFESANPRLFQVASHLHYALRLGLLIPEFRARVGTSVRLVVHAPVPPSQIAAFGRDARGLMAFLRQRTYALSPRPIPGDRLGYEFEARYREPRPLPREGAPGAGQVPVQGIEARPRSLAAPACRGRSRTARRDGSRGD